MYEACLQLFLLHNRKLIRFYTKYESLYTTVMVALNIYIGLHCFVALFYQMFKKCIFKKWNKSACIFYFIIGLQKLYEAMTSGNFKTESDRVCVWLLEVESWKIPESAEVTMSMNYESRN